MSSTPSPTQSEFSAGRLPTKSSVDVTTLLPADLKSDPFPTKRLLLGKRARFLITFCIGVVAALAWQSYGDTVRKMIANASPRLGWLAPQAAPLVQAAPVAQAVVPTATVAPSPDQQQLTTMSLNLAAMRQSVDQLAAVRQSVDWIAASQEQITRSVDQLAAGQEQMKRGIADILDKMSAPPPRPAPAAVRKPPPVAPAPSAR